MKQFSVSDMMTLAETRDQIVLIQSKICNNVDIGMLEKEFIAEMALNYVDLLLKLGGILPPTTEEVAIEQVHSD